MGLCRCCVRFLLGHDDGRDAHSFLLFSRATTFSDFAGPLVPASVPPFREPREVLLLEP